MYKEVDLIGYSFTSPQGEISIFSSSWVMDEENTDNIFSLSINYTSDIPPTRGTYFIK